MGRFLIVHIFILLLAVKLGAGEKRELSLSECIESALKKNRLLEISDIDIDIAKERKGRAFSGYLPRVTASATGMLMDEDPVFVFPEEKNLGITVPEKRIKLMDRMNGLLSLTVVQPVWAGGLIRAHNRRAEAGIKIARMEKRKRALTVVRDVKVYYYSAVLAEQLFKIADDLHRSMNTLHQLAEMAFNNGSGAVQKTEILKSRMVLQTITAFREEFRLGVNLAKSALLFIVGMDGEPVDLKLSENDLPFERRAIERDSVLGDFFRFNPDWRKIAHAMEAYEANIDVSKSEYWPKVALFGSLNYIANPYDKGTVSPQNKFSWSVGVGIEIPIFNGLHTRHHVREMKKELEKLKTGQILFKDGKGVEVKTVITEIDSLGSKVLSLKDSADAAHELSDLTFRAYRARVGAVKEVVEARMIESVARANYRRAVYDHLMKRIALEYLVGREIEEHLEVVK